ncbi:hypothetical protein RND71_004253 [Anisodus tanguticus]|uniref:Uncharacterized protein n=1 Tax=Anisodus tanguticus TaxID=243964 RepID=A0AAE1SZB4_9SOLA|nr:hypothetical protein RND71_004253 [Anisodus tanguticus]
MDLSIWDPPENPDESSYLANSWQYNLYYDPRLDVIEEDALNEKSCVQVLKILIKKADSEIAELEDDILMLQRQLACKDDMHFVELNKKIVNLDSMLRALKNEKEQVIVPARTLQKHRSVHVGSSEVVHFIEDPTRVLQHFG